MKNYVVAGLALGLLLTVMAAQPAGAQAWTCVTNTNSRVNAPDDGGGNLYCGGSGGGCEDCASVDQSTGWWYDYVIQWGNGDGDVFMGTYASKILEDWLTGKLINMD